MATQPSQDEPKFDDTVSELLALGWTPPASVANRYRHLLKPFYMAKGFEALPSEKLDRIDIETLGALLAVFHAFDIPIPAAPEPTPKPGSIVVVDR